MKQLKSVYFILGMTGMFAMVIPPKSLGLNTLALAHAAGFIISISFVLAALLTVLAQSQRRYTGPEWPLQAFAASALGVLGLLFVPETTPSPFFAQVEINALARIALITLFCLTALHTQPASEHIEGLS